MTGNTAAIKGQISTCFNMNDLATLRHHIRLQILQYGEDQFTINLQSYLRRGLEETGMEERKGVFTSIEARVRLLLRVSDEKTAPGGITQYQKWVGTTNGQPVPHAGPPLRQW